MTPASAGLSRYYEHVLQSMSMAEIQGPTNQELNSIELEEDIIDDNFLEDWDEEYKVYH